MQLKPVSVMWECTIACGLRCLHCKASARVERSPRELSFEESLSLIDQMLEFGKPYPVLRITGGNALRREDLFDIIRYATDAGVRVTVAPSTTPLLTRRNIERLQEAGCEVVAMSIDGATKESHDAFRGRAGTFDTLVRATKIMRELGMPFRLLTTVTRMNAHELPEIMALAKRLGAAGWYLYMLIPTGRATKELALSPEEHEDVYNFIYDAMVCSDMTVNAIAGCEPYRRVAVLRYLVERGELEEEVLRQGELYRSLRARLDGDRREVEVRDAEWHSRHAGFGKGIFVAHTGEVYPSSFMPITLGSVREQSLREVYRSSEVLHRMQSREHLRGRCGACEFSPVCRGSRSRAYAVTGDYLAEDPYCIHVPGSFEVPKVDMEGILHSLRVTNFSKARG